ncbi:hypothetical protein [Massilia aerilata]|uniref:RES domain-containing protein n=1 Tax=Massilia aerilata TaxID=453817 RepID=A0ABW0RTS2_9BURK
MTYQSRYQPRRQQTTGGKIKNSERYDIFYDIAFDAMLRGDFPCMTVDTGTLMLRVVNASLTIEQARSIPPGSSMNGNNRFSGPRLDGRNGQGALYMGTVGGVLREHAHYSLQSYPSSKLGTPTPSLFKPGAPDTTRAFMQQQKTGAMPHSPQRFHLFRLKHPLQFADLRMTALAPLFHRLRTSGEARSRYGMADNLPFDMLISAASDAQDYSAARGIADAVFDRRHSTGLVGVCAASSRADTDSGLVFDTHGDPTGGLIFAIFDKDGAPITALEPAAPKGKPNDAIFDTFESIAAAVG